MAIKWCHNAVTGEIFSYNEYSDGNTDFPRGTFLAYNDYLTTGFNSKQDAIEWGLKHGECRHCKSSRPVKQDGNCIFCGNPVVFHNYVMENVLSQLK